LTGYTNDPLFPATAGAYQITLDANATMQSPVSPDAFAVKLSPSGGLEWATYLGGPGADQSNSIGLDNSGNVWVVGNNGADFPITAALFPAGGAGDFIAELGASGSTLTYSAEFPGGAVGQSLSIDPNGVLHVAGANGLISTLHVFQAPAPRILGVVNAAEGQLSGRVAPGEVVSIFGFGLGPATPVSAAPGIGAPFPTTLGGVEVQANGTAIPLLYVSGSQINAEIPAPLSADNAILSVTNGPSMLPAFRTSVDAAIGGIFVNPDGTAKAVNQDGSLNSSSNPATAGSIVSIWATGVGGNSGPPADGQIPEAADDWCRACSIDVGSVTETVTYAGAAPGLIDGVMQINFMIPTQSGVSPFPVVVQFGGGGATVYVSQ